MNQNDKTIDAVKEAIRFIQNNWVSNREPVWFGDIHEFMANIINEEVTFFHLLNLLDAISKGEPIEGLEEITAIPYRGKVKAVQVRRRS
tara:strand:+ start:1455 stop:1721 length:267 start_codon:yes stop_codon:yes gene_type:complete